MNRVLCAGDGPKPFLKWPGGKRWLAPLLKLIIRPELRGTYYEPFLGTGAVFLMLKPKRAVVSDISGELISCLDTLRSNPDEVLHAVWRFSNTKECYQHVRSMVPRTKVTACSRFIYLNRTCWGGLYRINRLGKFNVPFGNSGRKICSKKSLQQCAQILKDATLLRCDFEETIAKAAKGDVIYADPPYTLSGKNNGFLRYNDTLFSWYDQNRLAVANRQAAGRGAFVIVSGLLHKDILKLYPGWWVLELPRKSLVSREIKGRRTISEILLLSRRPVCRKLDELKSLTRNDAKALLYAKCNARIGDLAGEA